MCSTIDIIATRLGARNLIPLEIDRLVKDVSNAIAQETCFDSDSLKIALQKLGWDERLLDYRTLELIFVYLEDQRQF